HGFGPAITARGMLGMRVLWFERAADDGFIGAADYDTQAVAMTGTHDTATVAGWWSGADIDWAERLGRLPPGTTRAEAELRRDWDRGLLWATLTGDAAPRPLPENPAPVVEAALRHIGRTPCVLAIAPLEDLLAQVEQPNLPGTITEHPNWRRRLDAPLAVLLGDADTAERLRALDEERKSAPSFWQ
ncbi:MAG TPA: 4-alpha-glucanotransferase, partial [Novosphingobium sp.]|nr:4-alpha-glucanotransferase [Novosphingobium sp.]